MKKTWAVQNFARYNSLAIFVARSRKNSLAVASPISCSLPLGLTFASGSSHKNLIHTKLHVYQTFCQVVFGCIKGEMKPFKLIRIQNSSLVTIS